MKINQAELLRLGTPKKKNIVKLTKEQQILLHLKKHGRVNGVALLKAVRLSGHFKEITENMAFKNLIKIEDCECGSGKFFSLP
ncbi:MAG: hypothetical protein ACRENZ_02285 [Thermodesulfobacteriota bacterium]